MSETNFDKSKKHRGWVFTLNNYTDDDVARIQALFEREFTKYGIFGREVGEKCGTPHLQGYIEFTNPRVFSGVKKLLGSACHIQPRFGTPKEASDYCKKGGDFFESGDLPSQGERNDLNKIKDDLLSGATTVDKIVCENPQLFHQYGRTLERLEDARYNRSVRKEPTKGLWYWGSTGVGKSHIAFEGYTVETHYVHPAHDKGWWDGYKQQEIVIINDFRGEIPYNEMLNLVDKWPHKVPRRGREPINFTSRLVIVTSSLPPWEVYCRRSDEDKIDQLLRRFEVSRILSMNCMEPSTFPTDHDKKEKSTYVGTEVIRGNTITLISDINK